MTALFTHRSRIAVFGIISLALFAPAVVFAGSLGEPVVMNGLYQAEYRDIHSDNVDETFRVFIAKPSFTEPGKTYPVIYALDGNGGFGGLMETARLQAMGQEIPNAFVVGIGYAVDNGFAGTLAKRYRDYTPTRGGELENIVKMQFDPTDSVQAGGGPEFLKFLLEELKPAIEAAYPVDPDDATLGGSSLGGLFPSWVLLTAPESFQRYVIISPSIWWNSEEVWQWMEQSEEKQDDIDAYVFVTAGGLETAAQMESDMKKAAEAGGPWGEMMQQFNASYDKHGWPKMAEITPKFVDRLNSRNYPGLKAHCHNLPDETHMSVSPGAWSRGLRYVFGHWTP
jgi:predicted alpha/beta superfamily hydrolase